MSGVVKIEVGLDVLFDAEVIVMTAALLDLELVVETPHDMEVLAGVETGAIVGGAPGTGAEVNASALADVTNAWWFALPVPL